MRVFVGHGCAPNGSARRTSAVPARAVFHAPAAPPRPAPRRTPSSSASTRPEGTRLSSGSRPAFRWATFTADAVSRFETPVGLRGRSSSSPVPRNETADASAVVERGVLVFEFERDRQRVGAVAHRPHDAAQPHHAGRGEEQDEGQHAVGRGEVERGVEEGGERDDPDGGGDEREHSARDRDPLAGAAEVGESVRERLALGRRAEKQCHAEHPDETDQQNRTRVTDAAVAFPLALSRKGRGQGGQDKSPAIGLRAANTAPHVTH